jgi:three-Cys-motif partner protein
LQIPFCRCIISTKMALVFDEIGYWSEIKLDIIEKYALEYSKILSKQVNPPLHHVYIDAFAGPGTHISKTTKGQVRGSPQIALDIKPPFKEYYFIDTDGDKVAELSKITINRPDAHILQGNCNLKLLTDVFPKVKREDYRRGLCLLDPYGLDLDWEVIKTAGTMKSIEIFLNFPVMDMNRNVLWRNPEGVDPADIKRMNTFWGDESWKKVAYYQTPNLFGDVVGIKEDNRTIALAFQKRLKEVAKFKYAPEPIPMRNSIGRIVYYLFFASQNQKGEEIVKYILNKYRSRGMR